jgi:hypothetical protein
MSAALRKGYPKMSESYSSKPEILPNDTDPMSVDQGVWLSVTEAAEKRDLVSPTMGLFLLGCLTKSWRLIQRPI